MVTTIEAPRFTFPFLNPFLVLRCVPAFFLRPRGTGIVQAANQARVQYSCIFPGHSKWFITNVGSFLRNYSMRLAEWKGRQFSELRNGGKEINWTRACMWISEYDITFYERWVFYQWEFIACLRVAGCAWVSIKNWPGLQCTEQYFSICTSFPDSRRMILTVLFVINNIWRGYYCLLRISVNSANKVKVFRRKEDAFQKYQCSHKILPVFFLKRNCYFVLGDSVTQSDMCP